MQTTYRIVNSTTDTIVAQKIPTLKLAQETHELYKQMHPTHRFELDTVHSKD